MLKIMIVDDEILYRQYLVHSVDWNHYGFEICCEAPNGLEALEKIEIHKPDIALVDINMPFMDGLELTENLIRKVPGIVIILVTGHSEFDYARKAVKLGVYDYILKPFNKDELMAPLLKIKKSIEETRLESALVKEDIGLIRDRLLNVLISNEFTLNDKDMIAHLDRVGIMINGLLFRVALVEIDNLYQKWNEASEIVLWQSAVTNILNEIINVKGRHIVFTGPEGRIVSLVEVDEDSEDYPIEQYQRLCDAVNKYLRFTITVGIGTPVKGFKAVRSSYIAALVALQNKIMTGNPKVIDYAKLETNGLKIGFYPSEINENLLMGFKMNDLEAIKEELKNVFVYIQENRLSFDYTITILFGLVSLCLSYLTELGKNIEEVFGKGFSPYSEIRSLSSIDVSHRWIVELFEKVIQFLNGNKLTKSRKLVEKVKEYIDANLHDNELDQDKIAGNVYINSSYLRKSFKKETGMTVTDYITNARIHKAKELLSSGSTIAISRISEMVGYSDVSYFSKSFKKFTGLSPSEYENKSMP